MLYLLIFLKVLKEAKKMLESILDSSNRNNALLELAKTEFMLGNVDASKVYLNTLLNTPNRNAATIELGRIEYMQGNIEKSIALFKSLIGTCSEDYALPLLININIKLTPMIFNIEIGFRSFLFIKIINPPFNDIVIIHFLIYFVKFLVF